MSPGGLQRVSSPSGTWPPLAWVSAPRSRRSPPGASGREGQKARPGKRQATARDIYHPPPERTERLAGLDFAGDWAAPDAGLSTGCGMVGLACSGLEVVNWSDVVCGLRFDNPPASITLPALPGKFLSRFNIARVLSCPRGRAWIIKPLDSGLRRNDDDEEKSPVAIPIARLPFLADAWPQPLPSFRRRPESTPTGCRW